MTLIQVVVKGALTEAINSLMKTLSHDVDLVRVKDVHAAFDGRETCFDLETDMPYSVERRLQTAIGKEVSWFTSRVA